MARTGPGWIPPKAGPGRSHRTRPTEAGLTGPARRPPRLIDDHRTGPCPGAHPSSDPRSELVRCFPGPPQQTVPVFSGLPVDTSDPLSPDRRAVRSAEPRRADHPHRAGCPFSRPWFAPSSTVRRDVLFFRRRRSPPKTRRYVSSFFWVPWVHEGEHPRDLKSVVWGGREGVRGGGHGDVTE